MMTRRASVRNQNSPDASVLIEARLGSLPKNTCLLMSGEYSKRVGSVPALRKFVGCVRVTHRSRRRCNHAKVEDLSRESRHLEAAAAKGVERYRERPVIWYQIRSRIREQKKVGCS